MPRKLPPFVECWSDRHGKMRAYYRRDHGPRIPLPNTIGSPAFNAAYQDALAGRLSGTTAARPAIVGQGTVRTWSPTSGEAVITPAGGAAGVSAVSW